MKKPAPSLKKKKSKYESKWESRSNDMCDLFPGLSEPVLPTRIEEPIEEEKDVSFTCLRDKKIKSIVSSAPELELTKKGNLRSEQEIVGIVKAKVRGRQRKKQAKLRAFNELDKQRDVERSKVFVLNEAPVEDKTVTNAEWKKSQDALRRAKVRKNNRAQYTAKQKADFREMSRRNKLAKKTRKQENRLRRNLPKTEAFTTDEFQDAFGSVGHLGGHVNCHHCDQWRAAFEASLDDEKNYEPPSQEDFGFASSEEFVQSEIFERDISTFKLDPSQDVPSISLTDVITNDIDQFFARAKKEVITKVLAYKDVWATFLFAHQMYCSPSVEMDVSLCIGYAFNMCDNDLLSILGPTGLFINSFRNRNRLPKTESLSSTFADLANYSERIMDCALVSAIRQIVLIVVSWKLFSKDFAKTIMSYFGKVDRSYSIPEAMTLIFSSLSKLIAAGEMILSGASLSDLLFCDNPVEAALSKGANLMLHSKRLYYGLPIEGRMDHKLFVREATEVLDVLHVALKKKFNPLSEKYLRCHKLIVELEDASEAVKLKSSNSTRATPVAFVVEGHPGIGKSSVMNIIYQAHEYVHGRRYDPSCVFEKPFSTDYWDGYDPWTHTILHVSEPGSMNENLAKVRGDDGVKELLSIVDSAPYALNYAAVEDKGKIHCLVEGVVIDTNNPGMNLELTYCNPAAYRRRFMYIRPTVRPEFCKEHSVELDPTKGKPEDYFNKWTFDVYVMHAVSTTQSRRDYIVRDADTEELKAVLVDHIRKKVLIGEQDKKNREQYLFSEEQDEVLVDRKENDIELEAFEFLAPIESLCHRFAKFSARALWSFFMAILPLLQALILTVESQLLLLRYTDQWYVRRDSVIILAIIGFLFHYCGYFSYYFAWLILVFTAFDFVGSAEKAAHRVIDKKQRLLFSSFRLSYDRYVSAMHYMGGNAYDFVSRTKYYIAGIGIVLSLIQIYLRTSKKADTEASNFPVETVISEKVRVFEDSVGCKKSYKRVNINESKMWNTQIVQPSSHKSGPKSLNTSLERNVRRCEILSKKKSFRTHILGIKGCYALANKHAFGPDSDEYVINIFDTVADGLNTKRTAVHLVRNDLIFVKEDLVLFRTNCSFRDILMHFPLDDIKFANADGFIGDDSTVVSRYRDTMPVDDKHAGVLLLGPVITYKWRNHTSGMCGYPVVARRDSGSCIVGIHSAGSSGNEDAYGIVVLRGELLSAMPEKTVFSPIFSESQLIRYGGSPHPKSPVCYEDLGPISYYGCVRTPNMHQKSSLKKSVFAGKDLDDIFYNALRHVRKVMFVPPLMKPRYGKEFVSPYNYAIRKMNVSRKPLNTGRVYEAVDILYDKILSNLRTRNIPKLTPIDMESAINGIPYDAFIRRMDMTKAAGFETPGSKGTYATRYEEHEDYAVYDDLDDTIKQEVLKAAECYLKGEHYGPVYKAQLKDEPRAVEKVRVGKTRVFFASPFAYLILQRMFLSPLYSLMIEFSEDFYTSIGIDMHRQSDHFFHRLVDFSSKILEGDYEGYDQRMPFEIGHGANTIELRLLGALGYDEMQLKITAGILSDGLYPFMDFIGEMFCVPGLQPSGKYGTAEDNSIRNLLIMVYSYLTLGRKDFFEQVLPCTYGDDVLAAVKPEVSDVFNNVTLSQVIAEHTDMRFTSSSKDDIVDPFVPVSDMSFLKRTFRRHKVLQRYVGCLDLDSVYKSLQWVSPSSAVNIQTQIHQIAQSALRELFFHCDSADTYDIFRNYLQSRIDVEYGDGTDRLRLITYDDLKSDYLCPLNETVQGGGQEQSHDLVLESAMLSHASSVHGEIRANKLPMGYGRPRDFKQGPEKILKIKNYIHELEQEIKEQTFFLEELKQPYPGLNYRQIKQSELYVQDYQFRFDVDRFFLIKTRITSLQSTINRLWASVHRSERGYDVVTESDTVEMSTGEASSAAIDTHENVVDVGGDEKEDDGAVLSSYLSTGQDHTLKLDNFFSRPLAITTGTIPISGTPSFNLDIWNLYLGHPSIRSKLRNYAYLRADLHVRIAFSGSPFHYGKILISYQPFADQNENLGYLATLLPKQPLITYLSQSPVRQIIDVKENKPVEMVLPYISPQPMGRLFLDSPLIIAPGSDFTDLDLGRLYFQGINDISCASTTPSNVSYFVYAWMENVKLGAPTGTVISIDTEADERESGPIQRIATRASEIAYALTSVPSIAPLARASAITLQGVASLSSLFGFSVPVMNNEPSRVKNEPFQNGAVTIGYDTSKRLVLDPKQELSVDPRVAGTQEDEMSIAFIASVESYLDSFNWLSTDLALSSSLWMCPVNPYLSKEISLGLGNFLVQPTALSMSSTPFEYWRGDITYRFEIACSAYHRGKIAFYFEPNVAQNVVIDTVLDMNKQFVKVIDIQETQEVCFTVKWAFPKPWAHVALNNTHKTVGDIGLDIALFPELLGAANGYIAVVPFTKLQSPDNSDIEINVYVSSDNMMYNQFTDRRLPTARPVTEAQEMMDKTCMDLNDSSATMDYISEEYFGEMPVSFRSLLKRFSMRRTPAVVTAGSGNILFFRHRILPEVIPSFTSSANLTPNLYSFLRYAYMGMRGGIKRRILILGDVVLSDLEPAMVHLSRPSATTTETLSWVTGNSEIGYQANGSVGYIPHTNGGVEFELPFYTNNAFVLSFSDTPISDHTSFDQVMTRDFKFLLHAGARTGDIEVVDNFAIGEDFSFLRFQGASPYLYTV